MKMSIYLSLDILGEINHMLLVSYKIFYVFDKILNFCNCKKIFLRPQIFAHFCSFVSASGIPHVEFVLVYIKNGII